MEIGKSKDSNAKTRFALKDGDNIYRILPPLGRLAQKGRWSMYYAVEWGYKDSKGFMHPFIDISVLNAKTKMYDVDTAARQFRDALKLRQTEVAAKFKAGKATREQVTEITELCKRYNKESKHYMNAVDLEGKIGLLKIPYKAKQSLDGEIKRLMSLGIDPRSVENGVFFNFNRTGKGFDTVYKVTEYQENVKATINGKEAIVQQRVMHEMDDAFIARLDNEAWELDDLFPTITAEEIQEMVDEGATAVDRVFNVNVAAGSAKKTEPAVEEEIIEDESVSDLDVMEPTPVLQKAAPVAKPAPVAAPAPKTVAKPVAKPEPVATTDADLDDAAFLASLGI